jgi:proton-dependent oligopeptide transporter, POT family
VKDFPRIVWVSLLLEFVERFAFYGVYVNLQIYLLDSVHITEATVGLMLGWFAAGRAWIPVLMGAFADRLGFRRSLTCAFVGYVIAYACLFGIASAWGAGLGIFLMSLAGAFLKPVIPATVRKYSPQGKERIGFSMFYASVNAGSVVGKVLTKIVRTMISLRATMVNALVASAVGLLLTLSLYREPALGGGERGAGVEQGAATEGKHAALSVQPTLGATLAELAKTPRLFVFLALVSGYYLLIEQFYQTFPVHIVRLFGESAPREYITLINPAAIALLQMLVTRISGRLNASYAMAAGVLVGACSMLLMGAWPTLVGACASFFVFALAEMVYSPRYYEYVTSFAPKGREGLYMGVALIPQGLGGLVGGVLSGRLIAAYLPKVGPKQPFAIWSVYSAIGVVCALLLAIYARQTNSAKRAS